ncbi:hypothetical protein, partial [Rhodoblastus sp.]|uniref:hypothetical protein n=1 Tax=Rhodoblastus sp. TaxID=1962975 RepID=UPI003F9AA3A8
TICICATSQFIRRKPFFSREREARPIKAHDGCHLELRTQRDVVSIAKEKSDLSARGLPLSAETV